MPKKKLAKVQTIFYVHNHLARNCRIVELYEYKFNISRLTEKKRKEKKTPKVNNSFVF